ncbi:MAG: DUF456 family protein [Planctomycetaceae bacterium]
MASYFWYYFWAILLIAGNLGALAGTMFSLPGNWLIVGLTALFAWLVKGPEGLGIGWWGVGALIVLATVGEIVEFAAGAAGAAKSGGSRRGMVLALGGSLAGSIVGVFLGSPIPLVGSLVGAIGGGALGAFCGAYVGEAWKGREEDHRIAVSKAALVGRLLGTVGKLTIGAVMVVLAAADALIPWASRAP